MTHIDWLSIVGRREVDTVDWSLAAAYQTACDALVDRLPTFIEAFGNPLDWEIVRPRAPYSYARRSHDCTRTLYVHPLASHFTLELTGQACQRAAEYMPSVCEAFGDWLSRLDIAVDMECDVSPVDFDAAIDGVRVKTHSVMQSATGQTVYRGSRTSDRFARVYRYNPPHPRAHLLRAEFQLKNAYARQAAAHFAAGIPLDGLAEGQGAHFGFNHACWNARAVEPVKLKVASHAQTGNTVAWLTSTIAPLLRRLQREGKLDVEAWMQEYIINYE